MAPKRERERYNAKGRQSTAGGSTHKKKKSNSIKKQNQQEDSNVEIIIPQEEKEKREELNRQRQQLLESNPESSSGPISSKKRKRLDNFIASKLKKENHVALLAKLSESSKQVTDRSGLLSASTLGTGKALSGNERLEKSSRKKEREADKRREARGKGKKGLAGKMQEKLRRQEEEDREDEDLDENQDEDEDDLREAYRNGDDDDEEREREKGGNGDDEEVDERQAKINAALARFSKPDNNTNSIPTSANNIVLGSALARGPDGQPILPVMKKKKRKKQNKQKQKGRAPGSGTSWGRLSKGESRGDGEEDPDSDFDSSESENDEKEEASPPQVVLEVGNSSARDEGNDQMDLDEHHQEASSNEDEVLSHEENLSGDSEDEEEDGDEGDITDEDEEAVFMEAMRLRGLLDHQVAAASTSNNKSQVEREAELAQQEEREGSLPWEGFGSEGGEEIEVDDDEKDDQIEGSDDDEEESEEDEDEDESEEEERSRRRGIAKTQKSSGFKDWARQALGMGEEQQSKVPENQAEDSHDYILEPVEGKKQRVGDLGPQDGIARGPLGDSNPTLTSSQSPFSKFYYAQQAKIASEDSIVKNVHVHRTEEQKESRLKLPVVGEEENVTRTILENMVTVICGETGSGKTTQVPQFLYEKGFGDKNSDNPGMIGITQPRRVAALSMAARVASELSLPRTKVSHQIRYDATVSNETAIKFMTDGVLLRELATDFLLEKYSAIVIDEAHERSVNTDVLIGVLSRVVKLRADRWMDFDEAQEKEASKGKKKATTSRPKPLRLIIMSATLRVSDFTSNTTLFKVPPPVINIDARQHPVTVHFNRKTSHDYLTEATKKVSKIHARLPPGGILVFLTGQQEISTVCRRLESRYGKKAIEKRKRDQAKIAERREKRSLGKEDQDREEEEEEEMNREDSMKFKVKFSAREGDVEAEDMDLGLKDEEKDLALDVDDGVQEEIDEEALDSDDEDSNLKTHDADLPDQFKDDSDTPLHILPLYSLLPSDKQMRVFKDPPPDTRLVVVATNVAETSLTIPGIRYVVDCGRSKEKTYDIHSGLQSFDVNWISKASANQRSGRAGRTGPGHCYRLYSSAVFEDHFKEFSNPEILRTPVDGLVLSMKSMNIDNVINFPFPTPPDRFAIKKAETLLENLGALESVKTKNANGKISETLRVTEIGKNMSLFPVTPRFGKLLAQGDQHGCMPYVIALVAALSVGDPFIREQVLSGDGLSEGEDEEDEILPQEMKSLKNKDEIKKEQKKAKRKRYFNAMQKFSALGSGMSDTFRLLSAVGAYEYEKGGSKFCQDNFLRPKAMEEIHKLRAQLSSLILSISPQISSALTSPSLSPPSEVQLKVLRQLISASFIDQIAVRADLISSDPSILTSGGQNGAFRKGSKMSSTRGIPYLTSGTGDQVAFIHPSSSFFHDKPPEWIVFSELQRSSTSRSIDKGEDQADGEIAEPQTKIWLKTITRINPAWIVSLGRNLCSFSKPIEIPTSKTISSNNSTSNLAAQIRANKAAVSNPLSSTQASNEREVYLTPTYNPGKSSVVPLGWELPPVKAKQKMVNGRWLTLMD